MGRSGLKVATVPNGMGHQQEVCHAGLGVPTVPSAVGTNVGWEDRCSHNVIGWDAVDLQDRDLERSGLKFATVPNGWDTAGSWDVLA